jgi:hypothetical protein
VNLARVQNPSNTNPQPVGAAASPGASNEWSRSDHVHEGAAQGREVLTSARTYYVRTDGSDSNSGLTNTAGGAFLTIQKAINTVAALDISTHNVTIQVANGTYTGSVTIWGWIGTGQLTIQGNAGSPGSVVISTSGTCFHVPGAIPSALTVKDMRLQSTSGSGIIHAGVGTVQFGNIIFGACSPWHIMADGPTARVTALSNYSIVGGASGHWASNSGGYVNVVGKTITLSGTPAFAFVFAYSTRVSTITCNANTFSGGATGTRYVADLNAVVFTNGGGATYLPGSAAGVITTGGQYA